uniref:Uncharacterized protein n=1 Tax=Oryza meridionalis TaxID=40149 RepID=A0A0E0EGQ8_9ORYZ
MDGRCASTSPLALVAGCLRRRPRRRTNPFPAARRTQPPHRWAAPRPDGIPRCPFVASLLLASVAVSERVRAAMEETRRGWSDVRGESTTSRR